jgi:hypothetical protein
LYLSRRILSEPKEKVNKQKSGSLSILKNKLPAYACRQPALTKPPKKNLSLSLNDQASPCFFIKFEFPRSRTKRLQA